MYQSNAFKNFVNAQAKQFGHRYKSYAEEFKRYDDEELTQHLRHITGQMTLYTFNDEGYNEFLDEVERIVECMRLRQEFINEMTEDELL